MSFSNRLDGGGQDAAGISYERSVQARQSLESPKLQDDLTK
jgi:hypothetical protein